MNKDNQKNVSWFVWFETFLNEISMMMKSILTLLFAGFFVQALLVFVLFYFFGHVSFENVSLIYRIWWNEFPEILYTHNSVVFEKVFSTMDSINAIIIKDLFSFFVVSLPVYFVLFFFGYKTLKKKSDDFANTKFIRGSQLITEAQHIKLSSQQDFNFHLAKIPLPVDAETYHVLAIGSSGAGKTQLLKKVVLKARDLNKKSVIHDIKGDWISEFYDPTKDFILNPMDARSVKWNVWNDIKSVSDIKNFVSWIIPDAGKDPFWSNSARMILESIMLYCYDKELMTNSAIKKLLFIDGEELAEVLKGYGRGAEFAAKKDSFLNLQAQMGWIDFLADGDFSLKEWVKNDDGGFLFLSNTEETQALMKPVLSLAVQVISSALLNLPDDRNRRFYLFLDEFTSLTKLEKVLDLLKLGRSKGVSVWLLFQDFQQLEKIYSREDRATVINNTGSIVVLRLKEADAALYFARRFGKQEFLEKTKTVSMGVAANRDGLSFNEQRKEDFIVKDSEILNLRPLECFVMISFVDGVSKGVVDITRVDVVNKSFEPVLLTKSEQIQLMKAQQNQSVAIKKDIEDDEEIEEEQISDESKKDHLDQEELQLN